MAAIKIRDQLTQQMSNVNIFCVCVQKCCGFEQPFVFHKTFLTFRILRELAKSQFNTSKLFLDSNKELSIPDEWNDALVCTTLAAMGVRPISGIDDILAFRVYIKLGV